MTHTLYVEGSLCLQTDQAGWGALLTNGERHDCRSGFLPGPFDGAVTLMELAAVQRAVSVFAARGGLPSLLTLALRSTAALAVLRWVFEDAPFFGTVERPKRLKAHVREFRPLYDLHDDVLRAGMSIRLQQTLETQESLIALRVARLEMSRARRIALYDQTA